jgi:hypothetical protein
LPVKKRGSGIALLFLLGVTGWGAWHFRERLRGAASPYFEATSASAGADTSDAGASPPTEDAAALVSSVTEPDAAVVEDAAALVDAGEPSDAMSAADADDGGDEEEDEEEDAAVAVLTFADAAVRAKPVAKPYHPKTPTRRKKKRVRR